MKNNTDKAYQMQIKAVKVDEDFESATISTSMDVARFASKFYHDDITLYESAFIMLMNKANKVIAWAKLSQGGVSNTILDTKIILKYTVETMAASVIIVHNHPSGNPNPSSADIKRTEEIKKALNIMDSSLLDHIVISKDIDEENKYKYFSFTEETINELITDTK